MVVADQHHAVDAAGDKVAQLGRRLVKNTAAHIYERCDLTVAATRRFAHKLGEMGLRDVALVPLGADLELFHPRRRDPDLRRRWGVGPRDAVLVYAGRLVREKRVDVLADALDHLPSADLRLVLVGEGGLGEALRERAAADPRLVVWDFVDDRRDLAAILASADVYVTAGPHETFGLSVVEAMACGLPVVGVDAGALRDRVAPGTGCLARPGDPRDFAEHVSRLLVGDLAAALNDLGVAPDELITIFTMLHGLGAIQGELEIK